VTIEAPIQSQLDVLLDEDLASVRDREQNAFDRIVEDAQKKVVLFGAGNLGQTALACLRSVGIEPLAFSDNNPALWGRAVNGLTVLSPSDVSKRFGDSAIFFVTIWSEGHSFVAIREQLAELGVQNVLPVAPVFWKFSNNLLPNLCQDLPHKVYEDAEEVKRAAELWADGSSLSEYVRQVKWRALGDYGALGTRDTEESYFPESIFSLSRNELFVDCGAYDGDTLRAFIRRQGSNFTHVEAFEPDPANYAKLTQCVSTLDRSLQTKITLHNLAVGASRTHARFGRSGTDGAAVTGNGEVLVEAVPLDEMFDGRHPTFLKMDIEGAEHEALAGARLTIETHYPVLAVCVYHKPDDLWRLPLFMHSLYPDYRFFLRAHEADGWQTVCYAVPAERCRRA
jgi:FkbM family methyltransferase